MRPKGDFEDDFISPNQAEMEKRGLAFMTFDGGYVSDVVISNLTVECVRHD